MDGRKRQRLMLEPLLDNGMPSVELAAALPMATTISTESGGGAHSSSSSSNNSGSSIYLTNGGGGFSASELSANLLLAICDNGSDYDDSQQEYLINESDLALAETETPPPPPSLPSSHIKHEQDAAMETHTLPVQYRLVTNHLQRQQLHPLDQQSTAQLPANVQLPSGCEIYLVKEYLEASSPLPLAASGTATTTNHSNSHKKNSLVRMTIKQELNASPSPPPQTMAIQEVRSDGGGAVAAGPPTGQAALGASSGKRSYLMEAYKKRDDKRRATHNEVERRRRDKINSWIFKLKEMLPTEAPPPPPPSSQADSGGPAEPLTRSGQKQTQSNQQQAQRKQPKLPCLVKNNGGCGAAAAPGSNRTVPCDSKSQILIKACEYIKTMQDELKSLRECLAENEQLRARNQRLELEMLKFKSAFAKINANLNNNNNNNNNSSKFTGSLNGLISNQCVYNHNNNNNNHHHISNNSAGTVSLEILPIEGDFESGFLLTPVGSTFSASSDDPLGTTTNTTKQQAMAPSPLSVHFNSDAGGGGGGFIKHELILNDLNV